MEPSSNHERGNNGRLATTIFISLGILAVAFIVIFIGLRSLKIFPFAQQKNTLNNAANINVPVSNARKNLPPAPFGTPTPTPTPPFDKNKAIANITSYMNTTIQEKYATDSSTLALIFGKDTVGAQWGWGPTETRVYVGFNFVPLTANITRNLARVFPRGKINSLDTSNASSIVATYYSQKENAPWNCTNSDGATICKSVWTTDTTEYGYRVTRLPDGSIIAFSCSVGQNSPLFKKDGDCFL